MANTVEVETPAERRNRWRRLTHHLRTHGLRDVPDDFLLDPLETTRTEVPLVACYKGVKQVSKGRTTPKEFVLLVIAILSLNLVTADPEGMKFWLLDSGHWAAQLPILLAQSPGIVIAPRLDRFEPRRRCQSGSGAGSSP